MSLRDSGLLPTDKKGGDPFYNTDFNRMAQAANVVNTVRPGTFAASIFTGDYQNNATFPAWTQHIVEVVRRKESEEDYESSGYGVELCEKKFPFFELLAGNIIKITTPYDEHKVRGAWTIEAELDLTFVIREVGSSSSSTTSSSTTNPCLTPEMLGRPWSYFPLKTTYPIYLLGKDANGCIGWFPVGPCEEESSESSASSTSTSSFNSSSSSPSSTSSSSTSSSSTSSSSSSVSSSSSSSGFAGCIYIVKYRYYDGTDKEWKLHYKEWEMDASDLGILFQKGDKVVAYWDEQRLKFVPCWRCDSETKIDVNDVNASATVIHTTGTNNSDINFALEISTDGGSTWKTVNSRVCKVNGNIYTGEYTPGGGGASEEAHASGCAHYTFLAKGEVQLRVRAETNIDEVNGVDREVAVERASLRLVSNAPGGVQNSLLEDGLGASATVVPGWSIEAEI